MNTTRIDLSITPLGMRICDAQGRDAQVMISIIHRCDCFAID
ncbi:hypothetical protein EV13_1959 [Prochlorococcus sp. MIT 0702]|nr:hypothetical protein EV13_1959 [Prochlorococcus sp. MIT 0702]KGG28119.1 hypothetical protein EV12_0868 [Prochlorococcus sp. MIT 0701]KGG32802.1 hypothetical protein EV14_1943 [Prochlorococcus sp. MIT 0703]